MKLEDATCENTCQYSLTGMVLKCKLLWTMKCNSCYAIFAVEMGDTIYKAYVWSSSSNRPVKIGKIFYVKFGRMGPHGHYHYEFCDKDGKFKEKYSQHYLNSFEPEYNNMYERDDKDDSYDSDD